MGCAPSKTEDDVAKVQEELDAVKERIAHLEKEIAKVDSSSRKLDSNLQEMIIPRTINEMNLLRQKRKQDPDYDKGWTEEDEKIFGRHDALQKCLAGLDTWCFDSYELDHLTHGFPLPMFGYYLFKQHNLIDKFKIPVPKLIAFLRHIQAKYNPQHYHNVVHATEVCHAMHFWMRKGALHEASSNMQLMAAFVGAMCHDCGHPGYNNAFMVNSKDKFSILYNDISVLENMHLALLFETYNEKDCDFLCDVTTTEWNLFRKQVIDMVLATDFGRHNEIVSIAQERLKRGQLDLASQQDYDLAMKIAIKCADLRHCMMPHEMTQRTTGLLMEEFWSQGDDEAFRSLPMSPFMNRRTANLPKEQAGFYQFMLIPLISLWAEMVPDSDSTQEALDYAQRNWHAWKKHGARRRKLQEERRNSLEY